MTRRGKIVRRSLVAAYTLAVVIGAAFGIYGMYETIALGLALGSCLWRDK